MTARIGQPTDAELMQDYLINWNAGPLGVVLQPDLGTDMPPVVVQLLPQPSVLKLAGVQEGDLLISINGKKTTRLGYEKVVRLLFQERLPMVLHFRVPLQERARGNSRTLLDATTRVRTRTSSTARTQTLPSRPRGRSDVQQPLEPKRPTNVTLERDVLLSIKTRNTSDTKKKKKTKKTQEEEGFKAQVEEKRLRKQFSVVWERGSLGLSFRAYNAKVNVPCVDFISANRGQGRGMDLVCVNDVLIAINGEKTKALGVEKVLRWLHVVEKPVVLRFHASSNRVLDMAGELLPQFVDWEDRLVRSRRPTMPQTQPEFEPMPRPPRRNNSVLEQSMPRMERGNLQDREEKRQLAVSRRYSKDRGTYLEKELNSKVKDRRHTTDSINSYARGRGQSYGDGAAGDFRREPTDADAPHFDLKIEEHIVPHQRQQHEVNQPNQAQLLPVRSRTTSAARDDLRRQQQLESKSVQPPVTASARPRLASHDSQVSDTSPLSFKKAAGVVARATGKTLEECEFGGVPVLDIKEGTVQSKLMYIYAKACLAKEVNLDDKAALKESQPGRAPGNPLGRKTGSKYLSYTILQDDVVASNHVPGTGNGHTSSQSIVKQDEEHKANVVNNSIESKKAGMSDRRLDETFAEMQRDISIQPPSVATPPPSLVGSSSLVSSDTTSIVLPAPASVADDFISLKDFVMKGGNLTERCTTSSLNTTATPVQSTDGGAESDKTQELRENFPATHNTDREAIADATNEASGEDVEEDMKSIEPKEAGNDHNKRADPITDENQQTEKSEKMVLLKDERLNSDDHQHADDQKDADIKYLKEECSNNNDHEHADDEKDAEVKHLEEERSNNNDLEHADALKDAEVKSSHEDDGVSGIDSSNERDLAASVASLDDLLDFPLENGNHDEGRHDTFADDEEKNVKIIAEDKECMNTSLGMKLDLVQEEEVSEADDHEVQPQQPDEEQEDDKGHRENEEFEDGALSNPLVNERFRNNPDVRKVIKDKPALVVLVKETMIDEIQEILQSLQMESHFERHSTTAVGSSASPLLISQQDRDTEGQRCYRCGATSALAELNVASGQNELYCQECWELFFFSEDYQSPVTRASKTLAPSEVGRLTADEDALDEALKYSFHDSSITRYPWRYLQDSSSTSSSICDSNASSITDQADEVWL